MIYMKKGVIKKFVCGLLTGLMFAMSAPAIPSAHAADQQELGTKDGYDYELWNQNYQGTATMDVGSLMLKYGGGGHRKVGTCQFKDDEMDTRLPQMLDELKAQANAGR